MSTQKLKELEQLEPRLIELINQVGAGRAMKLAQQQWKKLLETYGGELSIGPCVSMLVPCECEVSPYNCDWCCGSQQVTRKVKEAKSK